MLCRAILRLLAALHGALGWLIERLEPPRPVRYCSFCDRLAVGGYGYHRRCAGLYEGEMLRKMGRPDLAEHIEQRALRFPEGET